MGSYLITFDFIIYVFSRRLVGKKKLLYMMLVKGSYTDTVSVLTKAVLITATGVKGIVQKHHQNQPAQQAVKTSSKKQSSYENIYCIYTFMFLI